MRGSGIQHLPTPTPAKGCKSFGNVEFSLTPSLSKRVSLYIDTSIQSGWFLHQPGNLS